MDSVAKKGVPFLEQFRLFVGFDWAKNNHDIVAVDSQGTIVLELSFPDTAEGWAHLRQELVQQAGPDMSRVAVAVETRCGPAVERLLDMGLGMFPSTPSPPSVTGSARLPMEASPTVWTPGVWPMRFAPTGMGGVACRGRTP